MKLIIRISGPYIALIIYTDPPNNYRHVVDEKIGDFRGKSHADGFLNFTDDLQYTIEYSSEDGSLPYMDILIHSDKSTSVYRKPTPNNLYVHYNSCAPSSSTDSVIRSLTRRAHILCSMLPQLIWTRSTPTL